MALATIILRSPNPDKAPDPAIFLQGGPGGAATFLAPFLAEVWRPILETRDLIVFDQRGTGQTIPGLFCPPLETAMLPTGHPVGISQDERPAQLDLAIQLFTACGQAYQEAGVDLTKYNSAENAADIEDLRLALGYEQINLIGASYGTNLALEAMRYRPATIRSVVLNSVVPTQNEFTVEAPASFNNSISSLAAGCAADAACNAAYPDLLGKWDSLYARLNAEPAVLPIVNLENGELIDYIPINGWDLTSIFFNLLYGTGNIPLLPFFIGEAADGNYEVLSLLLSLLLQPSDGPAPPPQSETALTLYFSTLCFDDYPFVSDTDFIRIRDQNRRGQPVSAGLAQNEAVKELCSNLGLGVDVPAFVGEAVSSSVPTFIVTGEYDPITPPNNAYTAASTLSGAKPVVVYPHGGHTPTTFSPCLVNAVAQFLNDPSATPDTSCIADEAPLPFVLPEQAQASFQTMLQDSSWMLWLR